MYSSESAKLWPCAAGVGKVEGGGSGEVCLRNLSIRASSAGFVTVTAVASVRKASMHWTRAKLTTHPSAMACFVRGLRGPQRDRNSRTCCLS